jgi:hypothetical protein
MKNYIEREKLVLDSLLVNDLNPNTVELGCSRFSLNNACFLAALSQSAYRNPSEVEERMKAISEKHGVQIEHKFIKNKKRGTELILLGCDRFIAIAFRGTQPTKWKDYGTDLKKRIEENTPEEDTSTLSLPAGHKGFRRAMKALLKDHFIDTLHAFSKRFRGKETPILLTGHSLGGALATLISQPLKKKGFNVLMNYNYAPPLTIAKVSKVAKKKDTLTQIYDIVFYKDYVPRAWKSKKKFYTRIGSFHRFSKLGKLDLYQTEEYQDFVGKEYFNFAFYHRMKHYYLLLRHPLNLVNE